MIDRTVQGTDVGARAAASASAAVVEVEHPCERVAVVALNRPERLNALDEELLAALADALDQLAADPEVNVVIVTGRGRGFCAGADLKQIAPPQTSRDAAVTWMRSAHRGPLALRALPQPTIAAVNGPAAGAGLGLALACDLRVAAPGAVMSVPFVHLGLGPDFGVSRWLADAVGEPRALELLYTGRRVDASEALELGIVHQLAEDALTAAVELAVRIAGGRPEALRSIKRTVRRSRHADDHRILTTIEPGDQAQLMLDPAFRSRMRAWLASRARP
jgi:enoyl-CoA hydratase/carnithine racemase